MKKVHKSVFFLVLAAVFAFVLVSFFGIYTTYGDITTTIVRGYKDLGYDRELEDMGYFALKSEGAGAEDLNAARGVVENRLNALGYRQFNVLVDEQNSQLLVEVPFDESNASTLSTLAQAVASDGVFEIRAGNEADDDGNPTGASETVILANDMVKSAELTSESNVLYTYYGVEITLTREGKAALTAASEQLIADETGSISYWLDGEKIGSRSFTEPITDASFTINDTTSSSYSVSFERDILISSGSLPVAFTVVEAVVIPNAGSESGQSYLLWGLIAALGAAMALFIIIFKMPGVCAAIMILLQAGISMAIQTGMFSDQINRLLTFEDLAVHLALILVSMAAYAFICSKVSAGVHQKLSPAKAVLNALNGPCARALFGFGALFALALCGYLLTDTSLLYGTGAYAYLGDLNGGFRTATLACAGALFCQVIFRLALKSISGGNWRSGGAFCCALSRGKDKNAAAASRSVVIAVALVLAASVALCFVLKGAPSAEKDGYSLYSVSYSTEDVDSSVLTPALLELDSSLTVGYGYATGGTAYTVTVMIPAGSETTAEQIREVMDQAYPDSFTDIIFASAGGGYSSAQARNLAVILVISIIVYGGLVALFANRFRAGGLIAAACTMIGAAATCGLLYICGLPFGHTFVAVGLGSVMLSAGISAAAVFGINAAKTAQNTFAEAVNGAVADNLGGCAAAALIYLLMFAALVAASMVSGVQPLASFAVGMLAASVIPTIYCYAAANSLSALRK